MIHPLTERIAALDDADLAGMSLAMAAGVDEGRQLGFPNVADWYDALGRLLDHERDWRGGKPATLPLEGATALVRAAAALSGRELAAVTVAVLGRLYGLPGGPVWDFLNGLLDVLRAEHGRRQSLNLQA